MVFDVRNDPPDMGLNQRNVTVRDDPLCVVPKKNGVVCFRL